MTAAAARSSNLVTVVAIGTLPGGTANNWVADTSDGNTANDYAVANSDGTVTYYVPSGIKFLVPYSAEDDGTFAGGENYTDKATSNPSAFRTLTVAAGAHIICNGEMNVNGQRHEYTQPHSGRPAGGHGLMKLEGSGTQLTVNGTLFCYGFIAGTSCFRWPPGTAAAIPPIGLEKRIIVPFSSYQASMSRMWKRPCGSMPALMSTPKPLSPARFR